MNIVYNETMSRKYRRRRKKSDDTASMWFLGLLGIGAAGYYLQNYTVSGANNVLLSSLFVALLLILAVVATVAIWRYRTTQRKLRALDIAAIDTMDPLEFEKYVAKLLKHRGFINIKLTERYDYGVDIVAEKDNVRWGVQVKRYKRLVKAEAVRQVVPALVRYKCDRSMVVTNSTFSRPARELASDNNCVLVDRDQLAQWIVEFQGSKF